MTALHDSMTMLRRNLRHARRYPSMTIATVATPVLVLLLFNYGYGGAIGAGIGDAGYIDYVAPGVILMAAAAGAVSTAVAVATDMTEGIMNRFRTMSIARGSVLAGHVIGGTLQTLFAIALVTAIAIAIGFRPTASPLEWVAAIGLLTFITFALNWLSAGMGLTSKSVETASNAPLPLQFLPFIGSAIVPAATMPPVMRAFAENQPFTPIIETLRGLLMGTAVGDKWLLALAWCAALTLAGYVWARAAFARERA